LVKGYNYIVNSFFDYLENRSKAVDSLLCVGLDPHIQHLDKPSAAAARDFCLEIVDSCAKYACAFKPNSAFFEVFGAEGISALREVISSIPEDIPVILDAKRGDISSTALAYSNAVFQHLGADAVTYSPYLGSDSVAPFVRRPEKGVFILCKTSNPGSNDVQILESNREQIYLHVARQSLVWSKHNNIGLVVGATDPYALTRVRDIAPNSWILCPGVGVQGASLKDALISGLRKDGMGVLITVSRAISGESDRAAVAAELCDAINRERESRKQNHTVHVTNNIAVDLIETGCVQFGDFTLKSGQQSPFYIDMRRLASFPDVLNRVSKEIVKKVLDLRFNCIAAIPYAGLPIGTAVSLLLNKPLIYPRRETKEYGTKSSIEGVYKSGETAIVLDDLISTGGSKFETINSLQKVGLNINDIVVLIDRQQGGRKLLDSQGYRLHAVYTISELIDEWLAFELIDNNQFILIKNYLSESA